MNKKSENPLDPLLRLGYTVDEDDVHTYYLDVLVLNRCINRDSETMKYYHQHIPKEKLDMVVGFELYERTTGCEYPEVRLKITSNPTGLGGDLAVVICEFVPPVSDGDPPPADGKTIIRFEKATRLIGELI